ncbi:cytochrome P450 [Celeribacter indicus]|uniref:Cytochrome P450 n=1 Tax=Celeribacter indicus TaxID=1208324 RepID=A0A0B5E1G7_9RHOB|nr:cytochrome P450 [Celeribacter indicus]AJE46307.1 cytochrome P450 [Celeribacter indicus]
MKRFSMPPSDPAFVQDPYPFYDRLRAGGRMVHWEELDLPVIAGHDGVSMALRDTRFGREAPEGFAPAIPDHLRPFYEIEAHSMLELEGERHRRLRSLVLRAFTSRRVRALLPDLEEITDGLIDRFPAGEAFDLLPAFCQQVPIRVISRLLGVPEEMGPRLLGWSHAMVAVYTPTRTRAMEEAAARAATEFAEFLRGYVEERRARPADDLITHLIAAESEGERLSTDELISTCVLLLNAGHEATVHALGLAVKTLLERRTPPAFLGADRIDGTVEELLRFDPPLHLFQRWVNEDTVFLGQELKRGDRIGLLLGAANRDDDAWDDPHAFDPARKVKQNMSFGAGLHFCVGAPLARLEMRVALPRLFDRCPGLHLTEPPVYADTWHFHGLDRLMVRL